MATVTTSTRRRTTERRRLDRADRRAEAGRVAERWHPWPARGWPSSAREERQFVGELRELAATEAGAAPGRPGADEHGRREITAVLNALRSGVGAADLLRFAPGLSAQRLLAAHRDLEARRADAVYAWQRIVARPTPEVLDAFASDAASVLPVVISRLAERRSDPAALAASVAAADEELERIARIADGLEAWLDDPATSAARKRQIGQILHHLDRPGLWHHECFLPERVGVLVSVRVAALLGERSAAAAPSR